MKRPRFTLTYRVALLVTVLLIASALATTAYAFRSIQDAMYEQSEEAVGNAHAAAIALIDLEYADVQARKEAALADHKTELQDLSASVASSLDSLQQEVASGVLTEEQAKEIGLDLIRSIRYGKEDYFFAYDRGMTAIAHPDPKFQGKYLGDMQDPDGKYVIREIRDIALGEGSGFLDYKWVRLGEDQPSDKLGYVFHYAPWDWIIGTGVYIDDIEGEAQERLNRMKDALTASFQEITFTGEGFFFILDDQGAVVVGPGDKDMTTFLTGSPDNTVVQQLDAAEDGESGETVTTIITAPGDEGPGEQWEATSSTFAPLGWRLVSVVPEDELTNPGRTLAIEQLLLSLGVLVVGLLAGLLLSRRLAKPVEDITRAAQDLANDDFDPTVLDRAAKRGDEIGTLAQVFQRMASEIIERERKLRAQVARLTVEIDKSKVESAVEEITESEYFTRLKSQAGDLRRRMKESGDNAPSD